MGNSNNSSKTFKTELEEQHIDLLLENTSFTREQILDWHSGFLVTFIKNIFKFEQNSKFFCIFFM